MTPSSPTPPTGQEIRVKCAEAMGYSYLKRETWPRRRPKQFEYIVYAPDEKPRPIEKFMVPTVDWDNERVIGEKKIPAFDTHWDGAAELLVTALEKEGWIWHACYAQGQYGVEFAKGHQDNGGMVRDATAATLPLAIALCFLATKGLEP